jgi:hypothetical protein
MELSVSNEEYATRDCAKYTVRNRSDRAVRWFSIELRVASHGGATVFGANSTTDLKPEETVEVRACRSGGRGRASEKYLRLLVYVHSVDFGNCLYQPSLRIPRSLKVDAVW